MFEKLLKKIKKNSKRRGRGYGSGRGGHTVGKGQKGQKSRGKGKVRPYLEGGNTPLHRRIPKYRGRGFKSLEKWISINLKWLSLKIKEANTFVDIQYLKKLGIKIPLDKKVRIFGRVKLTVPFRVADSIQLTKGAKESLEEAQQSNKGGDTKRKTKKENSTKK